MIRIKVGDKARITFFNIGKVVTGEVVKCFPSGSPISDEDLKEYYGLEEGDEWYRVSKRPCNVNRYAFRKDNGNYLIIPDRITAHFKYQLLDKGEDRKMKVLVKEPNMPLEEREIADSLEAMQSIVGGYIEHVPLTRDLSMVVNEEGKLDGLEPNFIMRGDMIVGTVFFCNTDDCDFVSISDVNVEKLKRIFNV